APRRPEPGLLPRLVHALAPSLTPVIIGSLHSPGARAPHADVPVRCPRAVGLALGPAGPAAGGGPGPGGPPARPPPPPRPRRPRGPGAGGCPPCARGLRRRRAGRGALRLLRGDGHPRLPGALRGHA